MNDDHQKSALANLTAGLISSYVSHNSVQAGDLPALINAVYSAMSGLDAEPASAEAQKPLPPVSIKKSITPDYLISMEDGRHYQSLKRHLAGRGLTPAEYREKWGLPRDYPMTAPGYSARRSELAKASGLGSRRKAASEPEPVQTPEPELVKPKRSRGHPKKDGVEQEAQISQAEPAANSGS